MENTEKNRIKKQFFDLKQIRDTYSQTHKDLSSALRFKNVINSSVIENDIIDSTFIQVALYKGNTKIGEHFSPIYRKLALEAIGLDQLLRYLEKTAPKRTDLSVSLILKLHRLLFEKSWPDIAGRFRDIDVRIRGLKHRPAHPARIPEQIYQHLIWVDGLMKLLGPVTESNFFEIFHVAADVHFRVIETYPFRSGNWRIARALCDYVLLNSGMFYNVIDFNNRDAYQEAISQSSVSNIAPLEDFLLKSYSETLDSVKDYLYLIKKEFD